jgi:hypothetical protein
MAAEKLGRYVSTIFCDDLRLEVGNKLSLMGVYNGRLFLSSLPAVLPKLCVMIIGVTPFEEPFRSVKIKLLKNDELYLEHSVPDEAVTGDFGGFDPEIKIGSESQRLAMFAIPIAISPFKVDEPFVLRVRVEANGREIPAPGLLIGRAG